MNRFRTFLFLRFSFYLYDNDVNKSTRYTLRLNAARIEKVVRLFVLFANKIRPIRVRCI